jgi:aminoglycoside phosphotransferase (APT) family kinase protein
MDDAVAPSDVALWRSVAHTLVTTVLPAIADPWARTAAIQLVGLAVDAGARLVVDDGVITEPTVQQRDEALIASYRGVVPHLPATAELHGASGSSEWVSALEAWLIASQISKGVSEVQRIATGNSRAMWKVVQTQGPPIVVRIEQGGVFGSDGTTEANRMRYLAGLGVPVAPVLGIEPTGTVLGHPFFVMQFVDSNSGSGEDRSLPDAVAADYVKRLHGLHSNHSPSEWGATSAHAACLEQIDRWDALHRASVNQPVGALVAGADWLRSHLAVSGPAVVVHGDPGPGNFLHDGERCLIFTDWEFVHGGHPCEDWAFLIRMRGARTMTEPQWLQLIERETGVVLDEPTMRYWAAFNYFKGACANLTCLAAFEGPNPAPNMAIIGTALQRRFQHAMTDLIAT